MGFIFKSKKEKQQEKEINEYLDEYEKIEKETEKEANKDFNFFKLFEKDPLEEELKTYMTDEQLKDQEDTKKKNKILIIISSSIMLVTVIIATVIIIVVNYNMQDDLHKIHLKEVRDYYNNKYNTYTSIEDIQYICHQDEERNTQCSDIIYAHTKDNSIVIKRGDEFGDNKDTSSIYNDYRNDLLNIIPSDQLIEDNPTISYTNFYDIYYQYIDYIKVLPNKDYNSLINNHTLTIRDIIIYQGDLDNNALYTFISKFAVNSELVLIKVVKGSPVNIKVVNHTILDDIDVTGQVNLLDDQIFFQLDSYKNNVSSIELTKISTTAIKPLNEGSTYSNPYSIKMDLHRSTNDFNRDSLPSYYLIQFNNLTDNNMIQFSGTNEIIKENYKYYYYINVSDKTYVFSNQNISIANVNYNNKQGIFK